METHHFFTLFCVWMSPSSLEFYIVADYLSMDQPIRLWFCSDKSFELGFFSHFKCKSSKLPWYIKMLKYSFSKVKDSLSQEGYNLVKIRPYEYRGF